MKLSLVSLCFIALAVALPAGAQSQPKTIARINAIAVKLGEAQQWEAGTKRLDAWKKEKNRLGTTYIWAVISGRDTGEYLEGLLGRDWKDFDAGRKLAAKDGFGKEVAVTVAPYTESYVTSYYALQPDISSPVDPNQPPAPMSKVTFFNLKPGSMSAVIDTIKKTNAAEEKTHWTGNGSYAKWYVLVNGGEMPQIVLFNGLKNYAALQAPSLSLGEILAKIYGKPGAQTILRAFNSNIRSEYSELISYRPDLSYIPAKN